MRFSGIPFSALDFYEDLEADNSKTFWAAHKATYDADVRAPLEALAAELEDEFGPAKFFRPYRDIRFSADKTPYKTHQGVWFEQSRRYVHVGPAGLYVAGGYWRTSTAQIARLRRAVADDVAGPALASALADARGFTVSDADLARVPRGFAPDHPRADLLRHKTLTIARDLGSPAWLPTRRALSEVRRHWRAMAPVVDWLDQHVGED